MMSDDYANKMWSDILKEILNKGDALMDICDSVCIVRLRQIIEWSHEEMRRIKGREEITDVMWADYEELISDVLAANRLLEYFGASVVETGENDE